MFLCIFILFWFQWSFCCLVLSFVWNSCLNPLGSGGILESWNRPLGINNKSRGPETHETGSPCSSHLFKYSHAFDQVQVCLHCGRLTRWTCKSLRFPSSIGWGTLSRWFPAHWIFGTKSWGSTSGLHGGGSQKLQESHRVVSRDLPFMLAMENYTPEH